MHLVPRLPSSSLSNSLIHLSTFSASQPIFQFFIHTWASPSVSARIIPMIHVKNPTYPKHYTCSSFTQKQTNHFPSFPLPLQHFSSFSSVITIQLVGTAKPIIPPKGGIPNLFHADCTNWLHLQAVWYSYMSGNSSCYLISLLLFLADYNCFCLPVHSSGQSKPTQVYMLSPLSANKL